jgi:hypothetical protein
MLFRHWWHLVCVEVSHLALIHYMDNSIIAGNHMIIQG